MKCDHPDCGEEGLFRAPKTRELKEYYHFCKKHAAEYNKSWNYFDGLSQGEIEKEARADETWRARTFKFGLGLSGVIGGARIEDPLGVFGKVMGRRAPAKDPRANLSPEQKSALDTLGLGYPCSIAEIKAAYKRHVKLSHPDLNGKQGEERFKEVVKAYRTLASLDP
ncbi:MAG: J domain-containing protein [Rickettsiales bacterium]|jgi:curved DNA-binding protein CbpA|nr:J domain-containing protein [Rickettsiales bacterium]